MLVPQSSLCARINRKMNFAAQKIIGNWSDHKTMLQEKFREDLTPHQVKYRTLKR